MTGEAGGIDYRVTTRAMGHLRERMERGRGKGAGGKVRGARRTAPRRRRLGNWEPRDVNVYEDALRVGTAEEAERLTAAGLAVLEGGLPRGWPGAVAGGDG